MSGIAAPAPTRRFAAVDWSGDRRVERRHDLGKLWLAEVVDGELVRLVPSSRRGVVVELCRMADADPDLVVGLDFSFSFPAWFLDDLGAADGPAVWPLAGHLDPNAFPFFGRAGTRRPPLERCYRHTEAALRAAGLPAKSTLQTGAAGAPGTASLTGMVQLLVLRAAGMVVWPFDPVLAGRSGPVVAEIYPRAFTGAVVKSRSASRLAAWTLLAPEAPSRFSDLVVRSDDAFDAAVSALGLAALLGGGSAAARLRPPTDPVARREGWILAPDR